MTSIFGSEIDLLRISHSINWATPTIPSREESQPMCKEGNQQLVRVSTDHLSHFWVTGVITITMVVPSSLTPLDCKVKL
jgi:hypothetical protein